MSELQNKIALVTGGSRGIGAATAQLLAEKGAKVAISYNSSADRAKEVVAAIKAKGGEAIAIQANGADKDAPQKLLEEVVKTWNAGIDILVNNAGTFATGTLAESGVEVYEKNFDLNVRGVYETTRAALPHFNEDGRIINIGSSVANFAFPGASAYGATKAAIVGLTRSWAKELAAKRITVNTVHPGSINTEMNPDVPENDFAAYQKSLNPLGRYGTPREIAATVVFLASPDASFITGSEVTVDGGMTA
ncbi:MAG: 3-oxoacyl-ACP reductase family protein [Bacteroidota bacterium]